MIRRSTPFSKIDPRPIEWVWRRHLPAGMISALGGHPGRGKSLISFHIAADVSRAGGDVLISNTEDRLREISRPRMAAAGGNLDHVHTFDPALRPLPEGFDQLAEEVRHHRAKLVVLDPWTAHVSVPPGNPGLVRAALDPVEALCEETGCSVLVVAHQVKHASPNANPLMTVGGPAAGLVGLARAVYLIGTNPSDADQFVMAPAKFNLGEWPSALSFELDVAGGLDEGDDPEAGFLSLRGECAVSARELVRAQYEEREGVPKQSKSERAAEWLSRYLWEANGPVEPKTVVYFAARETPPITARQLKRAAQELGVTDQAGGRGSKWELPDDLRELLDAEYGREDDDDG